MLGTPVDVARADEALAGLVDGDWSRCRRGDDIGSDGPVPVELTVAAADGCYGLATTVTQVAINRMAGRALMLHAGGLATDEGLVVALVGRSGAGKSTAVATLARNGFGYVTDETVAVRDDGSVLAYPKPLSIVEHPNEPNRKRQEGPDALGLRPAPDELRLGPVVLLDRDPSVEAPTVERTDLPSGLLEVTPHTSFLTTLEHPLQRLCSATSAWGIHRLRYAEIADTVGLLRALVAGGPTAYETWTPSPLDPDVERVTGALRDGQLRRAAHHDAVVLGDEILVMVGHTPLHLQGVGPAVWRAAEGVSLAELVDAAERALGPHPDAETLTRQAVDAMTRAGALYALPPAALPEVMAGETRDP